MTRWPDGLKLWIWPDYRLVYYGRAVPLGPKQGMVLSALLGRLGHRTTLQELIETVFPDPDEEPDDAERLIRGRLRSLRHTLARNGLSLEGYASYGFWVVRGVRITRHTQTKSRYREVVHARHL